MYRIGKKMLYTLMWQSACWMQPVLMIQALLALLLTSLLNVNCLVTKETGQWPRMNCDRPAG